MPYVEERRYSTVCPKRDAKVVEERGRVMHCPACGFRAHRDNAPMTWRRRGTGGYSRNNPLGDHHLTPQLHLPHEQRRPQAADKENRRPTAT
ncbi:hypothetical protein Pisl_1007 [Pyrobaculum islandicum DSM 4184]|uniref:Uncharacterized protein n=1 Tax=Pyrobaculum islandicum (strain DSM 4184 / JCM 9189 / GEO3) TaxID=384616 RepID=A1RT99_PYRIL|nr:hypothetical protein Pisl_1007 [Pyrobaculum islandicum DSM 4184]